MLYTENPDIIIESETVQVKGINTPIKSLSEQSNKIIIVRCPLCLETRQISFSQIFRVGHTYDQRCKQRLAAYSYLIGQKIGRLLVTDFAEPKIIKSGGDRTTLKAKCDCGNETIIYAQSAKRAIKRNSELSCGCFKLEQAKQQGLKNTGPNNGMYDPSISDEERERRIKRRKIQKGKNWSKAIKTRDQLCIICGTSENLIAHHLYDFVTNEPLRYDPGNGITICKTHHQEFHYNYLGNTTQPCTPQKFYSFLQSNYYWTLQRIHALITNKNLLS